ncbi:hypothetical protein [Cytobacillus gottheilii]|uniref:hypothetical protein n=1 Tax=Cytobacillus gottheilii TaxID=859144 RepID=UPI0009BBBCE4|nr:hypothetical protein [Cytobacillus gottheilii]
MSDKNVKSFAEHKLSKLPQDRQDFIKRTLEEDDGFELSDFVNENQIDTDEQGLVINNEYRIDENRFYMLIGHKVSEKKIELNFSDNIVDVKRILEISINEDGDLVVRNKES